MHSALAWLWLLLAPAQEPPAGPERILLRTSLGDLVVALYPTAAPAHAARFLELARSGRLDGTSIRTVQRGFFIQFSENARPEGADRLPPFPPLPYLKRETGTVLHRRGILTMDREETDPDTARSSFSLLLADSPQLDGEYTAFGTLVDGEAVLEAFDRVEVDPEWAPLEPIELICAVVVDSPEALAARVLRGPRGRSEPTSGESTLLLLTSICTLGGLAVVLGARKGSVLMRAICGLALAGAGGAAFLRTARLGESVHAWAALGVIAAMAAGVLALGALESGGQAAPSEPRQDSK